MSSRRGGSQLLIDYESDSFPASRGLSLSGQLAVTWGDILWAAVTLGRPNLHYVFEHGPASKYEAVFRWSLVRMALEQRGPFGSRLRRTDAFRSLDPTEKGSINYFLGMTLCKLFADKLLGTPWLLHLDVFRNQLGPTILTGRSRPDLVGQEAVGVAWHAFESKGRASVPGANEKAKAKAQAQRLVSVNCQACDLHIGAITYFRNDVLRFYWRDPEPEVGRGISIPDPSNMWGYYYSPFVALLRDATIGGAEAPAAGQIVAVDGLDLEIGAHEEIYSALFAEDWMRARIIAKNNREVFIKDGYKSDGLLVRAGNSWRVRLGRAPLG